MKVKVSVIIPVYNSEKSIRKCLDSVLAQTLNEIEIICVDDGATDSSPQILEEYAQKDARVRVIHQENAGAGAARNLGLRMARGEYLSILDADDFFEPEMLALSYQKAKDTNSDIVVFSCNIFDDRLGRFRPCDYSIRQYLLPDKEPFCSFDVKRNVFRLFIGWAWDKLFCTEFIQENGFTFQEQRTTNDMFFVFSAIMKAQRITTMPQVLAHYRQSEGSLSVTREKSWQCFYEALYALREQLKQWGMYERFERDFINYALNFSLWNLNTLSEPTHTILFEKLRDEWFADLGISGRPEQYFYNKDEYRQYQNIMNSAGENHLDGAVYKDTRGNVLRRGWICLRDNGFEYTVRLCAKKIRKSFYRE